MSCILRILTGTIQDADNNSYHRVTFIYLAFGCASLVVSLVLLVLSFFAIDLKCMQWGRKKRVIMAAVLQERKERFWGRVKGKGKCWERTVSKVCFGATLLLMVGGWTAYFWGVAVGRNS